MAKGVTWEDKAKADMRAIDRDMAMRILRGLSQFLQSNQGDVKQLQDIEPPEFRLRVGDYRLRYYDRGDSIHVLSVFHRSKAYR